jgi:hypothetical protein
MNCDICHKDTTSGTLVTRGRYFKVHICPNCLMWSDDLRAVKAREIFNNFKRLQDKECVSISSEQE